MRIILGALTLMVASTAGAHSASDAYLELSSVTDGKTTPTLHGQWDIALRDLDFVLHLDDDGDGHVTWGEVRRHQGQIAQYAFSKLHFGVADATCKIKPGRQMVDDHADGAYAVLFFDVECARPVSELAMQYALFFGVDPSHRGIFVLRAGGNVSTAVLAPENSKISLQLR